ncbi:LacI family DNA-binding transcriptional regulator [Actinomadura sp. 21ATH]|uniref:LacI family DNA-binding transcriptional regulator n=1 Tax=Actinomadura sp. 21ATH TaxID=1735444 RepID=UPI0035BF1A00
MRPTLQTVADELGVSRSTVSNAYSRPDQLSAELREKVLETARRLGYPGPHPTARSLRRGTTGAIGVLLNAAVSVAFTDPYTVRFMSGLAAAAERHETGLLLVPLSGRDDEAAVRLVQDASVDGFCVYGLPDGHRSLDAVRARRLPIVNADRRDDDPDAIFVGIDDAAAARAAGAHLAGLGHRRIAAIVALPTSGRPTAPFSLASPDDMPYHFSRERLRGYRDALAEAGVGWTDLAFARAAAYTRADGAAAAALLLDRSPRPTAIVAVNDMLALGVLDALAERGLRPGHDVSVIGFDDVPEAAAAGLTTVRHSAREMGRVAGGLLLDPPAGRAARDVVLPADLVIRASTGPAPMEGAR